MSIDNFPYWVELSETHIRAEHVTWLEEAIPSGYLSRWTFGGTHKLHFTNIEDRTLFILRWA